MKHIKYCEFLERLPDAVLLLDQQGVIQDCNPAACSIYGFPKEELVGKPFRILQKGAQEEERPFRFGGERHLEEHRRRDGSTFTAEVTHVELPSPEGFAIVFCRDFGVLQGFPDAFWRVLETLEHLEEHVVLQDREGTVLWMNETAAASVNSTPEELVGRKCFEIWHGRASRCENCPVARCMETGEVESSKVETPDGRHWLIRAKPVKDASGAVIGVVEATLEITELEHTRIQLEEQKKLLRTVLDLIPLHVYLKDKDTRFVMLNRAAVEALGASSEEECLGKTVFDYLPWDVASAAANEDRRVLETGVPSSTEQHFIDASGRESWLRSIKVPLYGADGSITGIVGANVDETELKKTLLALQKSEERYRNLVENSPVGIAVLSSDGVIEYVNAVGLRILGADRAEQLCGRSVLELVHPDYKDMVGERVKRYAREEVLPPLHSRLIRVDGTPVDIESVALAFSTDEGRRIHVVFQDITQRLKEREELELLHEAVNQTEEGVVVFDSAGVVKYVNPAFERITGYLADEVEGRNIYEITIPQLEGASVEPEEVIRQIMAGKAWSGRISGYRRDGALVHIMVNVSPVRDEKGEIRNHVALIRDVTDQTRLEKELVESQKMEAIGRLAGGVAHDFNNMLTVIIAYSDILLRKIKDPEILVRIRGIREAADRAASLTGQLLAFSRKQKFEPKVLDLNAAVNRMSGILKRLIGEDINLTTVLEPELWPIVADPSGVDSVIMNLAVNARDAMPGGGSIIIETANVYLDEAYTRRHADLKPGPYVMLAVSDTGCGMDAETLSHIFEPFFTTKEAGKGTGLGLSIVYGVVKQSGGHITVYSEPGKGSSFKIYFPKYTGGAEETEKREKRTRIRGRETVLVVEDEEAVRGAVCLMLRSLGYKVLEAGNAEEAVRICSQPDCGVELLLTDVVMPDIGGKELAEKLVQMHPGLKVIYMSGYTNGAAVKHGIDWEREPLLMKPFTQDVLARKVREVLDAPSE